MAEVPVAKQTTYTQFRVQVDAIPNPEGGDPIRNLAILVPGEALVFPLSPEAAERIGRALTSKQVATPTDAEAAKILGADGQPTNGTG